MEKLCGKISLIGGEQVGITVTEGEIAEGREKGDCCLIGMIGTDRKINREAFKTVLSRIWRTAGPVVFKEVQNNVWVFEFVECDDKRRVLEGRPWSFDRHILVLKDFDGSIPPSQMQFSHSPFWIQVHDMPLLCMNKAVGSKIGESLGELEDVDVAGDGDGWGRCLRLRISIDLHKPLERGRALILGGKSIWVSFSMRSFPCSVSIAAGFYMVPKGVQKNLLNDKMRQMKRRTGGFGYGRRIHERKAVGTLMVGLLRGLGCTATGHVIRRYTRTYPANQGTIANGVLAARKWVA